MIPISFTPCKNAALSLVFCLFSLHSVTAQQESLDKPEVLKPAHRLVLGGGFGMGMSSALLEERSDVSPEKYVGLNLGYRLNKNFELSTGVLVGSNHNIQFERAGTPLSFSGSTTVIPVSISYVKDKEGMSSIFGLGAYYRTGRDDAELSIGDDMNSAEQVSNFGGHLKLGLAYNDYFNKLSFVKGARYDITLNTFTDGIADDNIRISSYVLMFGVAALF